MTKPVRSLPSISFRPSRKSSSIALAVAAALCMGRSAQAANDAWSTAPGSNTFTGANWTTGTTTPGAATGTIASGDSLYFGTSSITTLNNDEAAGYSLAGLTFNSGASAFTIAGNSIALTGNITNNSTALQTINDAITLSSGGHAFSTAGGNLTLGGNITGTGLSDNNGTAGALAAGGGTVTFGGTNSFSSGGGYSSLNVIGGSTLAITGATTFALGSDDYLAIGNGSAGAGQATGTLNIASSGTFNVSGGNNGLYIGLFGGSAGTLHINGTLNMASTTPLVVAGYGGGTGTVNLNAGGILVSSRDIYGGGGASTFNFNGGTLRATANNGGQIYNFTSVTTSSVNSAIDPNSFTTHIYNNISGAGGFVITDSSVAHSGLVDLYGNNTFTGGVTVNSGGLLLNSATAAGTGTITLAGGALVYGNQNFNNAINVTGNSTVVNTGDNNDGDHAGALTGGGTLTVAQAINLGGTTYNGASSFKYSGDISGFTGTFVDATNRNVFFQGSASNGSNARFVINGNNGGSFTGSQAGTGGIFQMGELSGTSSSAVIFGYYNSGATLTYQIGALNTNSTYAGQFADSGTGVAAITKVGTGTLTLSGVSSYTGATTVKGGTLATGTSSGSLTNTSSVTVNTGGTLLLANTTNQVNDAATIGLAGGTLKIADSVTTALTETMGALTLSANSIIDFGTGGSTGNQHILAFGLLSGTANFTLSVYNWTGTVGAAGGADQISFTNASSLSSTELANISFYSGSNSGFLGTGSSFFSPEVVPVPEPSTWVGAGLITGLFGWSQRRRLGSLFALNR